MSLELSKRCLHNLSKCFWCTRIKYLNFSASEKSCANVNNSSQICGIGGSLFPISAWKSLFFKHLENTSMSFTLWNYQDDSTLSQQNLGCREVITIPAKHKFSCFPYSLLNTLCRVKPAVIPNFQCTFTEKGLGIWGCPRRWETKDSYKVCPLLGRGQHTVQWKVAGIRTEVCISYRKPPMPLLDGSEEEGLR